MNGAGIFSLVQISAIDWPSASAYHKKSFHGIHESGKSNRSHDQIRHVDHVDPARKEKGNVPHLHPNSPWPGPSDVNPVANKWSQVINCNFVLEQLASYFVVCHWTSLPSVPTVPDTKTNDVFYDASRSLCISTWQSNFVWRTFRRLWSTSSGGRTFRLAHSGAHVPGK